MENRKQLNGTEARNFRELLPSQYLAPPRKGWEWVVSEVLQLGVDRHAVEHGSERGSCMAADPLTPPSASVRTSGCIHKQLGGTSVKWIALVVPQMEEPAFCAPAANAILVSPNFMTPIVWDISISTRTLAYFITLYRSRNQSQARRWIWGVERSLK
jgi:hypothetical protein